MPRLTADIQLAAEDLQLMIRAEAGARVERVKAVEKDTCRLVEKFSPLGCCVCVTCARLFPWRADLGHGNQIQGGHWLSGRRRTASAVMLDENNIWPQCSWCNQGHNKTVGRAWEVFMLSQVGEDVMDALRQRKNIGTTPTDDQILEIRKDARARTKAAIEIIAGEQ